MQFTCCIRSDAAFGAVEEITLPTAGALFCYELFHLLQDRVLLRRCAHCGGYFVVTGRPDTLYCRRPVDGGSTCALVGSALRFRQKCADNPALAAYQKAYKRYHARVRKGAMTSQEFSDWTAEAKLRLAACTDGALPVAALERWLGNRT